MSGADGGAGVSGASGSGSSGVGSAAPGSSGQFLVTGDGVSWFFDAGALSLDFAATADLGRDVAPGERMRHPADLGAWLADRIPGLAAADAGERDLTDALALRGAVIRLAAAAADGTGVSPDDVDTLNLFGATPDVAPVLAGGRRQAGAVRLRVGQALSTIARDAIRILDAGDGRIRRCEADDCDVVFHDASRTGTRRWCAMERCGNRAKVRAHRARKRAAAAAPSPSAAVRVGVS